MLRTLQYAERVLAIIAGIALFVMMILTFADVVGRYGFHRSIFGTPEIIQLLMAITVFAGLAFTAVNNEHITVTIFEGWISRNLPFIQHYVIHAFTFIVFAGISYQLWVTTFQSYHDEKRTAVLDLPYWIIPGSEAFFATIGTVLFAAAIIRSRGRLQSSLESGHYEES